MSTSLADIVRLEVARSIRGASAGSRLAQHFDELPLPLDEWLYSPDGLAFPEDPGLSLIQFNILRHAEQVYWPEEYTHLAAAVSLKWRPVRFVNFLWLMIGKGGGKDMTAAVAQLRIAYLLLCLRHPAKYLGIGHTSKIDMLNTASSEGQGETIYYEEFKGLLENAPCFKNRYRSTTREVWFDKRIHSISGNSKEEAQEGMNLLYGCLDEIDAFRTREEIEKTARTTRGAMLNADGIFEMMKTSASSRFPRLFKIMGLSWPRYVGSFIWRRVGEGELDLVERGSESRIYTVRAKTWEANPTKTRDDFEEDYKDNPELSIARYECLPPESQAPYFRNKGAIDTNFNAVLPGPEPQLEIDYYWGRTTEEDLELGALGLRELPGVTPPQGWQAAFTFAPWFNCDDDFLRAVHVDTGITRDRCGFAMSHVRGYSTTVVSQRNPTTNELEEVEVRRPLVTVDLVTYFEAPKPTSDHPRGEVELRWVRRLIFELIVRGFPIRRVTFDGYQSTDGIQILNAHGIESEVFSLDRKMEGYDTAKMVLYGGGMIAYPHALLQRELRALTVVLGKKVDHPPGGSKDCADAWAGSIHGSIVLNEFGGGEAEDVWYPGKVDEGAVLRGAEPAQQEAGDFFTDAGLFSGLPGGYDGFAGPPQ